MALYTTTCSAATPTSAAADPIAPALVAVADHARAAWKAKGWTQVDRRGRALPCPLHFLRSHKMQRLCGRVLSATAEMSPRDYPLPGHEWAAGVVLMLLGHVELIERAGGHFLSIGGGR